MVDQLWIIHLAHQLHIFADPVEDDDRIIQRVADDRHDGSDDLQVDLHRESEPMEEGQDAQRDDHVVDKATTAPTAKLNSKRKVM